MGGGRYVRPDPVKISHRRSADPVVLAIVEHWQQHIQVREQLRERRVSGESDAKYWPSPHSGNFSSSGTLASVPAYLAVTW